MNVLKKIINYHSDKNSDDSINNNKHKSDKIEISERKFSNPMIIEKENINKNLPHVVNISRSLSLEYYPSDDIIYNELIEEKLKTCDTKVTKLKKD